MNRNRVSRLLPAASLTGEELVYLVQNGTDRRATTAQLAGLPAAQAVLTQVQAARADVLAAVATTQADGRSPGASDDQAAGYRLFSRFFDTGRQVVHELVDAANGAATWVRRGVAPELPRRVGEGRWYCAPVQTVTNVSGSEGFLHLRPMILHERHTVIGLSVRSAATLGTGANTGMRAYIYRDGGGRALGAPIAEDAVGVALGSVGAWHCLLSAVLPPGAWWFGFEFTRQFSAGGPLETALPVMLCANANDWTLAAQLGVNALANQAPQGFRVAKAWGAAAPSFAANFAWDDAAVTSGMPIPFLRIS